MGKTIQVRVDQSLVDVFGRIGQGFAEKIKKDFNLDELFVPTPLASQLVAGKINGKTSFNFKVRKTGHNTGILELA